MPLHLWFAPGHVGHTRAHNMSGFLKVSALRCRLLPATCFLYIYNQCLAVCQAQRCFWHGVQLLVACHWAPKSSQAKRALFCSCPIPLLFCAAAPSSAAAGSCAGNAYSSLSTAPPLSHSTSTQLHSSRIPGFNVPTVNPHRDCKQPSGLAPNKLSVTHTHPQRTCPLRPHPCRPGAPAAAGSPEACAPGETPPPPSIPDRP